MKETYPLRWPEGQPRTRPQDRETRTAWKKTEKWTIDALDVELKRFGVLSATLTRKDPGDFTGPVDPSVTVFFAWKREEDFTWMDALGITNPSPSLEEIGSAYRRIAAKYHPDSQTPDIERFHAITKHADNAKAYVKRLTGQMSDRCIACDKFKEARWNINAIRNTIHSLRQMERDGTSALLEQALEGFKVLGAGDNGGA